jgi:hypothetical protein
MPARFTPILPSNVYRKGTLRHLGGCSFTKGFLFTFLLRQKSTKKGAPKTMTAVFGWIFEELLCKEVKSGGALVSALDQSFKESVADVSDKSRLSIECSIFSSSNPPHPNSDNSRQRGPGQRSSASCLCLIPSACYVAANSMLDLNPKLYLFPGGFSKGLGKKALKNPGSCRDQQRK